MDINTVNSILRGKRPVSAQPKKPAAVAEHDSAALKARIEEARKAVGAVIAKSHNMRALQIAAQARDINAKLVALEAELNKISIA